MAEKNPDPAWESATFDGLRRVQLREQARLPVRAKLDWLDDAQQFVSGVEERRKRKTGE